MGELIRDHRARQSLAAAFGFAVLGLFGLLPGGSGLAVGTQIFILGLLGLSVYLLYGLAGLPTLGQAAFYGVGSYAAGEVAVRYGLSNFWVVLALGSLAAMAVGASFGVAALRTRDVYFFLITFAFGELFAAAAAQFGWFQIAGVSGIAGISSKWILPGIAWTPQSEYLFVAIVYGIVVCCVWFLTRSPLGHVIRGASTDEARMKSLGYNTWLAKYIVYVLAALVACIAGVLNAYVTGIAVPDDFAFTTSGAAFLVAVMFGRRRIWSSLAGATGVVLVEHYGANVLPLRWPIALGALYVVVAGIVKVTEGMHGGSRRQVAQQKATDASGDGQARGVVSSPRGVLGQ